MRLPDESGSWPCVVFGSGGHLQELGFAAGSRTITVALLQIADAKVSALIMAGVGRCR